MELEQSGNKSPSLDALGAIPAPLAGAWPTQPQNYGDFYASGNATVQLGNSYLINQYHARTDVEERVFASLSFPQMHDRLEQISEACPDTYRWLLEPTDPTPQQWDCFRTWLDGPSEKNPLYWVQGKPGSGKSTLMRFLDDELDVETHLAAWAGDRPVIRLSHYFWSSGNKLQKSVDGLVRHLILQILEEQPHLIKHALSSNRKLRFSGHAALWSRRELHVCLSGLLRALSAGYKVFMIIDGLDECEDLNNDPTELIQLLRKLSAPGNVKICVSSRPFNIYKDEFQTCPQLRLEVLTYSDVETFVNTQLQKSPRWREMVETSPMQGSNFVGKISGKAQGVFLWIRLAMQTIMADLRDGDNLAQLEQRLGGIPGDLVDFFLQIMESIDVRHRREASVLLRLAIWEEDEFASVYTFSLLDSIFSSEQHVGSILDPAPHVSRLPLGNEQSFRFMVESTIRKINGRCKGLLECVEMDEWALTTDYQAIRSVDDGWKSAVTEPTMEPAHEYVDWPFQIRIQPLHRSLRDFLLLPPTQQTLHAYAEEQPIEPRLYLLNARIVQLLALESIGYYGDRSIGLASHIFSALSVYKYSQIAENGTSLLANTIDRIAGPCRPTSYWYIRSSFDTWDTEKSNLLSLAIDFRLSAYVLSHLTASAVRNKEGRPLLDYVLRPRFARHHGGDLFSQHPDLDFLKLALESGADPNQHLNSSEVTVWTCYLCFLFDYSVEHARSDIGENYRLMWVNAFKMMVQAGARLFLSAESLDVADKYEHHRDFVFMQERDDDGTRGFARWSSTSPTYFANAAAGKSCAMYAVSDLVRLLPSSFLVDKTTLLEDLKAQEHHVYDSTINKDQAS